MAHISPDFQSKKAFKEAVKNGEQINIFSPGPFPLPSSGQTCVEAPANYHKWYASVKYVDGIVTKVIS
jgi:hypothetical protein